MDEFDKVKIQNMDEKLFTSSLQVSNTGNNNINCTNLSEQLMYLDQNNMLPAPNDHDQYQIESSVKSMISNSNHMTSSI